MSEQNDRNLILKAAEVMGWCIPAGCSDWYTKHRVRGNRQRRAGMGWNPLESISDAWMLVERMRELGWDVSVDSFPGGYWSASFAHGNGGFSRMEGSDAPRAVTLAAIAAWESMKKGE